MKPNKIKWSSATSYNWFSWDGCNFKKLTKRDGEFKCFMKVELDREYLLIRTDKKVYNLWFDGKKYRLQGLR